MAKNNIKKGDTVIVKDIKSGCGKKGDWCFLKAEDNDKITIWADNNDFKAEIGDEIEILDITSCSLKVNKVGDKYYNNYNISALLKNKGRSPTANFDSDIDLSDDDIFI